MKSFVHIRDVVRGLTLALQRGVPGTYHFSDPSERTIADVVRLVCEVMGYDFDQHVKVVGERLGQDSAYTLDCTKAAKTLHWKPEVPFVEGVRGVVKWVENRWDDIRSKPLEYQHRV